MKKLIPLFLLSCFSLYGVDTDEQALIEMCAKNASIAFDVGAHAGEWTDIFLKYNSNAKLFLFEPATPCFQHINKKFAKYSNISVFHLGLSHCTGTLFLYSPGSPLGGFHFRKGLHREECTEAVEVTTLDIFCSQQGISHIDFLKIDTEGAELDIFHGASNLLSSKSIDLIQFEYGGTYLDAGTTLKECFSFLTAFGYKIMRIENGKVIQIDKWDSSLENYQLTNYCGYNPEVYRF